jgi:hypothetical protein
MSNDGVKIPVLEVEKFKVKKEGIGFRFYDSGRLHNDWTGCSPTGGAGPAPVRKFLYAPSSAGWLKVHVVSGSTYGPTGASYYIPLFKFRNTYTYSE